MEIEEYLKPALTVVEIELEGSILSASGEDGLFIDEDYTDSYI